MSQKYGRDRCLWQAGFGRLAATAPTSLRKITQGRQDDDACRIVRKPKSTGKIACATITGSAMRNIEIGIVRARRKGDGYI
jgi:hypothetical protein